MKYLKGYIPSIVILRCINSIMINIMNNINIFILKDNIIKKLREKIYFKCFNYSFSMLLSLFILSNSNK